jgi:hypothetical protein
MTVLKLQSLGEQALFFLKPVSTRTNFPLQSGLKQAQIIKQQDKKLKRLQKS